MVRKLKIYRGALRGEAPLEGVAKDTVVELVETTGAGARGKLSPSL